jgi:hypothetical protein
MREFNIAARSMKLRTLTIAAVALVTTAIAAAPQKANAFRYRVRSQQCSTAVHTLLVRFSLMRCCGIPLSGMPSMTDIRAIGRQVRFV